ncbi:MAG: hypothetical protein KKB81_02930 [Candidatus Margulisbacteria bacterium]|nr:hypothetical protein [Candidatus Margulisiibacteriota bacterium]MBU1022199.1 hypothetical protein [Candidatus Margulisiibacteriota bacterium]MBU1729362.1 hypothetical protein [Candidatus Margulisiibacteriota bacterium]MBU1955635.1 hypothetical protein [Candidatus Margulisiibacteriota bacterium]
MREEVAPRIIDLRRKTVRATHNNSSLLPVTLEYQGFILKVISDVSRKLAGECGIKINDVIGYEQGGIARQTCTPASDLDLNIVYPESHFAVYHPFEKNLIQALSIVLGMSADDIHNNEINQLPLSVIKRLPERISSSRSIRRGMIYELRRQAGRRNIITVGGFDLLNLYSWAALRDPIVFRESGLYRSRDFSAGYKRQHQAWDILTRKFIFGNEEQYYEIEREFYDAIDVDLATKNLPLALKRLAESKDRIRVPADISNLEKVELYAKKDGGSQRGFQLMFLLGFSGIAGDKTSIPVTYTDFLECQAIPDILGERLGSQLFVALDWLIKARAITTIYLSGGPDLPVLGHFSRGSSNNVEIDEQVLDVFRVPHIEALYEALMTHRAIIKTAIDNTRETFSAI